MSEQQPINTDMNPSMLERIENMMKNFMLSMERKADPLPYVGPDTSLYADQENQRFPIANVFGEVNEYWLSFALGEVEKQELSNEERLTLGKHLFTQYTRASLENDELLDRILEILKKADKDGTSSDISIMVNPENAAFSETQTMYEFPLTVQFSATEEDDGLTWRTILRTGTWAVSPSMKTPWNKGQSLEVTPERLAELKASFDDGAFEYVTVPDTHKETPLNNRGFVKSMKIVPDEEREGHFKLKAGFHITNEEAKKSIIEGSLAGVSCGILFDHTRKSDGKKYGAAIHHVALTNQPWIDGLGGWEKIAASEYNVATVEIIGTEEKELMSQNPDTVENTSDLEAQLAAIREENKKLRLSAMRGEVRELLNTYQKEKHFPPAALTAIEPIMLAAKLEDTKVLALSDDGTSTNEVGLESALKAFLDAMPAQTDLTQAQSTDGNPVVADQSKPETTDDNVELSAAEKAAEIRKLLNLEAATGEGDKK